MHVTFLYALFFTFLCCSFPLNSPLFLLKALPTIAHIFYIPSPPPSTKTHTHTWILSLLAVAQSNVHNPIPRNASFPGSSSPSLCAMEHPMVFHRSQAHVGSCRLSSSSSSVCVRVLSLLVSLSLSATWRARSCHILCQSFHSWSGLITKCVCKSDMCGRPSLQMRSSV